MRRCDRERLFGGQSLQNSVARISKIISGGVPDRLEIAGKDSKLCTQERWITDHRISPPVSGALRVMFTSGPPATGVPGSE